MLPSRQSLAADPLRPLYHFLPPANWMNDPNGLIQWGDEYHLFYQYNPNGAVWGDIHWGHAVSKDLVNWEDLPIALAPTPGGPDAGGCWTGCAVDNNGTPTLIYTGWKDGVESVCLATSTDNLRTWHKHPNNPVISGPPADHNLIGFRDPYVWRENGQWHMIIGAGTHRGSKALLYQSSDLIDWEYSHLILLGNTHSTMCECPNLFPLGNHHVLIYSPWQTDDTFYYSGELEKLGLDFNQTGRVDYGTPLFAPQVFQDKDGRWLMFGWLKERRTVEAHTAAGWAGAMSLPRHLTLGPDGSLHSQPVAELQKLRGDQLVLENMSIAADTERPLLVQGNCLEIKIDLISEASIGGLKVCCAPDDSEYTLISYNAATNELALDTQHASLSPAAMRERHTYTLPDTGSEPCKLHIFIDRSVIEIFTADGQCLTTRIYPTNPDSLGIKLFAQGDSLYVPRMNFWQLDAIWPSSPGS
ncbi:MAG: glycoside hydrolase family 32 protein [Anaerolineales bacterium]|nr:glycoside hydrolase family 32 protein [Anaerolineales bacterium]